MKTLSKRIEDHGEALRKNEALTRTALIDPLLRELGWNIEDPAQVIPEYPTGNNENADYVLLTGKQPLIVVEAKSLDSSLHGRASRQDPVTQASNYAFRIGTRYFSVTNGRLWEIYGRQRSGDANESKVVQFDLTDSPTKACLEALALWRPGVKAGSVSPAQPSIFEHHLSTAAPTSDLQDPAPSSPFPGTDSAWIPYSRLHQTGNLYSRFHQTGKKICVELQFPDGKRLQIQNGYEVATATVQWLCRKGHLKPDHCPIQRGSRYILTAEPAHPSKKPFRKDKLIGPFHVETAYTIEDNIKNACEIIERTGQEPTQFQIRCSS